MIHLEQHHLEMVKQLLAPYPYTFYAFGSRVTGKHKEFSDLDLCVLPSISDHELSKLNTAFDESNLPIKVDIVVWDKISDDFKSLVKQDFELLQ